MGALCPLRGRASAGGLLLLLMIASTLQGMQLGDGTAAAASSSTGGDSGAGGAAAADPRVPSGAVLRLLQAAKQYRAAHGEEQLLKPRQIHRALYMGDMERIRSFVRRMAEGENVTIALLGGSVSKGMGAVAGEPSFEVWLRAWLAAVAPAARPGTAPAAATNGSTVRLVNAACPATSSAYMNMCLREHLRDDLVDLVLVEYAINDDPLPEPFWENEPRKSFEQLLRKLLQLPRRPAVVLLNMYRWFTDYAIRNSSRGTSEGLYYTNTESAFFELATFYGLPLISVKAAVYHQMVAGVRGFQTDSVRYKHRFTEGSDPLAFFFEDPMHPSGLTGHRVLSELVVGMLVSAARSLVVRPWRQSEEELIRAPLPPHLIPGNVDSHLDMCLLGEKFRAAAVEVQGFAWLDEGHNPRAPKWGFTATSPGASIVFSLPAALNATATTGVEAVRHGAASGAPLVLVILAYLRSYENMGMADVYCEGGCLCGTRVEPAGGTGVTLAGTGAEGANTTAPGSGPEPGSDLVARLDGHWDSRTSQLQLGCFPALLSPGCRVRVKVSDLTRSGSHKVKLGGLITSNTAHRLAKTMCAENLEAAQRAAGYLER